MTNFGLVFAPPAVAVGAARFFFLILLLAADRLHGQWRESASPVHVL